jgi:hypothetical protein
LLEWVRSRKKQWLSWLHQLSRPKLAITQLGGSQPKWCLQHFQLGMASTVAGFGSSFSQERARAATTLSLLSLGWQVESPVYLLDNILDLSLLLFYYEL